MRHKKLAAVLVLLVGVAAACGGNAGEEIAEKILENSNDEIGDIEIDSDGDSFDMTIEGEDGETISVSGSGDDDDFTMVIEGDDGETMTFGGGDVPEGMQTLIPDGGDVVSSISGGGQRSVSLEYAASMFDSLVAAYDGEFSGDGVDRYETTSQNDDGTIRTVTWSTENYSASVTVSDCYSMSTGDLDAVCVSIFEDDS